MDPLKGTFSVKPWRHCCGDFQIIIADIDSPNQDAPAVASYRRGWAAPGWFAEPVAPMMPTVSPGFIFRLMFLRAGLSNVLVAEINVLEFD